MLRELCNASGVSGGEDEIRKLIMELTAQYNPVTDVMGNVLVQTGGNGKKIMLASHMDEVGLIISGIDENGFLKFKAVGGISCDVLPGKKVYIGKTKIPGVIGIRAVHLQKKDEEKLTTDKLYIDIGAMSEEEAAKTVQLGDYAAFEAHYSEFGDNLLMAKALDDRAGCAIMIELMKRNKNKNLCCAFTAQEEVGCRGAQAAANYFKPDIAIVIETTICSDVHPSEYHQTPTYLGGGTVVTFMDRTSVPDKDVMNSVIDTAKQNGLDWQFKRTNMGGTDAGVISRAAEGIPTAIVAIACRYLHSPSTVISLDDYNNTIKLLDLWIKSK